MRSFENLEYSPVRDWINRKREKNISWDELLFACKSDDEGLSKFIANQIDDNDWPQMEVEEWKELVHLQKMAEEETIHISQENGFATIHDEGEDNAITTPSSKESSWQCYKKSLLENGFKKETIEEIQRATLRVLRRLSLDTTLSRPIKGMVIGNVQSGKTANMAALMAMAADWGWNMFIVLSGSIENLRKQTQSRLFTDLNKNEGRLMWRSLEHLKARMSVGMRAQDLRFESTSKDRYFTVCLKNKSRLKNLIKWLQENPMTQTQMKIIVIDDEADQAGINTADVNSGERKAINDLICNLVNGKTESGKSASGVYNAMNYIGYTATPYANVLNEAGEESLYPRNFISSLCVSKEYFGPQQIFGNDDSSYDGLDIVREISDNDLTSISDIHDGMVGSIPESLQNSICWFMCGVACMRFWNYKKPISMLIHTSQKTNHHAFIAQAINRWISQQSVLEIISRCKEVWENEIIQFSLDKFREQYPDYSRANEELNNYPLFDDLVVNLKQLLSGTRISSIPLDTDEMVPEYHDGIHLCVDNCKNNGVADDMILRLVYPDKDKMPIPAPAFIVVGGATLSRGLTLEGLISTYFLRSVKQADTLMQMGRWFGYRKEYELIPRIWLSKRTEQQFQFLASLDQNLRDEIHRMDTFGISPSEYGPKVQNSPQLSFIRIVAKNRMQNAVPAELDYSGSASQTYVFDNDLSILNANLAVTQDFLLSLGKPEPKKKCNPHAANAVIWREIPFSKISNYLKNYHYQARQSVFNDIALLIQWVEEITSKSGLGNWNVVLAGVENNGTGEDWIVSDDVRVTKVIRTQKTKNQVDGILNLGALRVPKDIITDIDLEHASLEISNKVLHFNSRFAMEIREQAGLGRTPQLLIYIVNKNSKAKLGSKSRADLNAKEDIVGFSITIPGESTRTNNVASIHLIPSVSNSFDYSSDIDGTDED